MIIKILFIYLFASLFASQTDKGLDAINLPNDPCATVQCQGNKKCQVNPSDNTGVCVNKYCGSVKEAICQTPLEYFINYDGCLSSKCSNCNCSSDQQAVDIPSSNKFLLKKCICVDLCRKESCPLRYTCVVEVPSVPTRFAVCYPNNPCTYGPPLQNNCSLENPEDCPNGFKCSINGVKPVCCHNDPCNNACTSDQKCELLKVCENKRCRREPTCVSKCPLRTCEPKNCTYGYAFDKKLCKTCDCFEGCKEKVCKHGKKCVTLKAGRCDDRECPEYYNLCV